MQDSQEPAATKSQSSEYWMRALSFAGLHRLLKAISEHPQGLKAGEINELVLNGGVALTPRSSPPAPTTLYHYRTTLLRLGAIERDGRKLRANVDDPDVRVLLDEPAPPNDARSLSNAACDRFAALVLRNDQCRKHFFVLFMPAGPCSASVSDFRERGVSVEWGREYSNGATAVILQSCETDAAGRYMSRTSVTSVLYGVRYWARDELRLIDEYCRLADDSTVMYPLSNPASPTEIGDPAILQTVRFVLSRRNHDEWTLFSILDLIVHGCEARRQPITVLFKAVDWLVREWPYHVVLIPTSLGLATLTARSPQRENLELRRYYKRPSGPYISHLRIHKAVLVDPCQEGRYHVRDPSTVEA